MTVAWSTVETALETFVSAVLTAASVDCGVCWRDKVSKSHKTEPYLELSISGESSRGHDETEWEEVGAAPDNVLVPRIVGVREFTLQIRVRSRSQSAARAARNVVETLRAALYHPYLRQPLDNAGIAFQTATSPGSAVTAFDGRFESVGVLDARFATRSELYLPAQSGAPVEAVEVTPTLADVAQPLIEIP